MEPEEHETIGLKANGVKSRPSRTRRSIPLWICFGIALISMELSAFAGVMLWRLSTKVDDLNFGQKVIDYNSANDLLTPDVGVIQFMKRDYTVTFDRLSYTANGLEVSGTIGNPTQLKLSSVNLKSEAKPFPYQVKDKLKKDPFFFYVTDGFDIGSVQTTIFYPKSSREGLQSFDEHLDGAARRTSMEENPPRRWPTTPERHFVEAPGLLQWARPRGASR